jgi:hypothetical protein
LYIALGETDDRANGGAYARLLNSMERNNRQLKELWDYLQGSPQYKGKTTIIITIDHGGLGK